MSTSQNLHNIGMSFQAARLVENQKTALANQQQLLELAQAQVHWASLTDEQKLQEQQRVQAAQQEEAARRQAWDESIAKLRAEREARTQARIDMGKAIVRKVFRKARGRA